MKAEDSIWSISMRKIGDGIYICFMTNLLGKSYTLNVLSSDPLNAL